MYLSAFIPGSTWMQSVRGVYVCVYLCACMKKYVVPIILRFYSMQKKLNGEKVRKKNRRKKKERNKMAGKLYLLASRSAPVVLLRYIGALRPRFPANAKNTAKDFACTFRWSKGTSKTKRIHEIVPKTYHNFLFLFAQFFFCAFRLWIRS